MACSSVSKRYKKSLLVWTCVGLEVGGRLEDESEFTNQIEDASKDTEQRAFIRTAKRKPTSSAPDKAYPSQIYRVHSMNDPQL